MNENTFTRSELVNAFRRLDFKGKFFAPFPEYIVDALAEDILKHREHYEPGSWYIDACGEVWRYTADNYWWAWTDTNRHDFDEPTRPLRKLVPESDFLNPKDVREVQVDFDDDDEKLREY